MTVVWQLQKKQVDMHAAAALPSARAAASPWMLLHGVVNKCLYGAMHWQWSACRVCLPCRLTARDSPARALQGYFRFERVGKATTCTFLQLARNNRTVPYLEFRD
jgi:hypothetical protein